MSWLVLASLLVLQAEAPDLASLAAQVRSAEESFARSMAKRSLTDFADQVADDTVFFTAEKVLRGRAAVLEVWAAWFAVEQAPFSWKPESVEVLASGDLALSSGPVFAADGTRIGSFNSIWRLESDGRWRVVFDKGCN